MFQGSFIWSVSLLAILVPVLAGCGSQTPVIEPTPTGEIIPGPVDLVGYVECPPLTEPVTEGPGFFDDDDGFATAQKGPLFLDRTGCGSDVTDLDTAENWTFQGTTDQIVLIRVLAYADADPQLTVIDPNGDMIDIDDDSGGGRSSQIVTELPMDGVYTLRVAMFAPGKYMINVQTARSLSS